MAYSDFMPYDGPKDSHPVWKIPTVWVDVQIRHNPTGEIRVDRQWMIFEPEHGEHPSIFMFEEGNYACDCNRHLFFHRSAGHEPEDDNPCGDAAYSVNLINPKDGRVFYREFDVGSITNEAKK